MKTLRPRSKPKVSLLSTLSKNPVGWGQTNQRINPLAGISGAINLLPSPTTAPAANLPLRAAPSIVAGHSVAVQSPARKKPAQSIEAPGRNRSSPGTTEKVARASFSTPLLISFARFTSGKNIANSRKEDERISSRAIPNCALDPAITNST
jgi:hypothetical protein